MFLTSGSWKKDPAYAQAYLGLAGELTPTLGANDQASPREVLPKAGAAAQQALRWDESLGEAHAVFAWVTFLDDWNSSLAEREFKQALQLSPNYAAAHQWYGLTLDAGSGGLMNQCGNSIWRKIWTHFHSF